MRLGRARKIYRWYCERPSSTLVSLAKVIILIISWRVLFQIIRFIGNFPPVETYKDAATNANRMLMAAKINHDYDARLNSIWKGRIMTSDLLSLIKERRSVRRFSPDKRIKDDDILLILEAGIWAPTGCNNQELKFLVLSDKVTDDFMKFKPFLRGCITVIVVFCDTSILASQSKQSRHLPDVDTGLALSHMVLYAKSMGIDSCILNLSPYHFAIKGETWIYRIARKIALRIGLHSALANNLECFLRERAGVPGYLKIMGGVAFGYAESYPNVHTAKHGGKKIMRKKLSHYMVK